MRLVSLGNQNVLRKSWSKEDDIVQLAKPDDTIYKIMRKSQIAYVLSWSKRLECFAKQGRDLITRK